MQILHVPDKFNLDRRKTMLRLLTVAQIYRGARSPISAWSASYSLDGFIWIYLRRNTGSDVKKGRLAVCSGMLSIDVQAALGRNRDDGIN